MSDVRRVEVLLASRIGLDTASIGRDEVGRAVRRRMADVGCHTVSEYLRLIERGEEWDELVELVLVPETWFFREPTAFALVTRRAREHVAAGHARHFRVLSMPCSTGAEPYSVAITLREAGLAPDRFRVEALDLSQRALAEARVGLYGARAVRHVPPPLLRAYFVPVGDTWEVSRDARRGVNFSRGNVVDPDVLCGVAPFDIVFCRNVLIYLDATARLRLLDTAARLLRDAGVLVTGHAETATVVAPLFVSAGVPRTFAYVKPAHDPVMSGAEPPAGRTPAVQQSTGHRPISRSAAPVRVETPARAARTEGLDLAGILRLADAGRLAEAITACETWLERHPSSTEGHFMLGVAAGAAGRTRQAEDAFRRTLYLDPSHEGALTHLAALRERSGDTQEAGRLRRRARQAVGGGASHR